jgi:hypothetical protein
MSNISKTGGTVSFWKSKEVINFFLALIISLAICGAFWYGGHTACSLGGGFYYKFACVDIVEIPYYEKAPAQTIEYLPNCSSPLLKDNYVLCPIDNVTQN